MIPKPNNITKYSEKYVFGYSDIHKRVGVIARRPLNMLITYSYNTAFSNEYNVFIMKLLNYDL